MRPKNQTKTDSSYFSQDGSLDEVFRFDDKIVVGQRTNKNFIMKKQDKDGFFDFDLNAVNSCSILTGKNSDHMTDWINVQSFISENEERKNQRMVKRLQNININDSNIELTEFGSEITSDELRKAEENKSSEDDENNDGDQLYVAEGEEVNFEGSPNSNQRGQKEENVPTQKKPQSKKAQIGQVNQDKSTKSRPQIEQIKKRQLLKPRESQKQTQRLKSTSKQIQPKSKPKKIKRKRLPEIDQDLDLYQQPKLFKYPLGIQHPKSKNDPYQPKGRIKGTRYPERIRVPPFRYWLNERKEYDRGEWVNLVLVDDERGREVADNIFKKRGK